MTSPYLIRREDFYNKGVHVAALVFGGQRGSYLLSGDLKPGERLPSTRELARRFSIHPNTVSAGYGAGNDLRRS
jgi:hypothetical protein